VVRAYDDHHAAVGEGVAVDQHACQLAGPSPGAVAVALVPARARQQADREEHLAGILLVEVEHRTGVGGEGLHHLVQLGRGVDGAGGARNG
jgi:hypothetical protein